MRHLDESHETIDERAEDIVDVPLGRYCRCCRWRDLVMVIPIMIPQDDPSESTARESISGRATRVIRGLLSPDSPRR